MSQTQFDYQEECAVTLSDKYYGERVSLRAFRVLLAECIDSLDKLDKIKKALFYGRDVPEAFASQLGQLNLRNLPYFIHKSNDGTETEITEDGATAIVHAIIGNATEAAEQLEMLLNSLDGQTFDALHYVEEVGDTQWYNAVGLRAVGCTFDTCNRMNIGKLRKRFADKFSEYDANNRNLFAERAALESPTYKGIPLAVESKFADTNEA